MTRPSLLNLELADFLKPVKADSPLGEGEFRYTDFFHEIQQNVILGEELFTSDQPNYAEIYKSWEKVDVACTYSIKTHKKDILLFLYLVEAWFFVYEIEGLIMGVRLLTEFLITYKDALYDADKEWLELQMATLDFMDKKISQLILFFELTPSHNLMSAERITYYRYLSTRFFANKAFITETDDEEKKILTKKIETIEIDYYQKRLESVDALLIAMDALQKTIDSHFDMYQVKFVDTTERVKKYSTLIGHIVQNKQSGEVFIEDSINEPVSQKKKEKPTSLAKKKSSSMLKLNDYLKSNEARIDELLNQGINALEELTSIMQEIKQGLDNT